MNTSSSQVWLRVAWAATAALSIFLVAGCGGGSKKQGKVTGKVTYGGEPLGGGNVLLVAAGEHPQTFTAGIKSDGTYDLAGVPPGEYFVGVETESIKSQAGGMYNMGGMKPPAGVKVDQPPQLENTPKYVAIPPKYKDPKTSGLPKITVQQGSKEATNIDIPK
jgi:hypothetical protein